MQVSAGIFRADDVLGVVPDTLDIFLAEALGRVLGTRALAEGERSIAVGCDRRQSSPALADAVIDGLLSTGIDVHDLGTVTTPMASFAATTLTRSVVQVTAGHHPREYNGFRLVLAGRAVHGEDLQQLRRAIETGEWTLANTPGTLREADVRGAYLERIRADVQLARPLKVVLDCGNGVAGATSPDVLRAIGCDVVELDTDVDGQFADHHPDPARPGNLQDLLRVVRETGADVGLVLDGNGDRVGVVTPRGGIAWPDRQTMGGLFSDERWPGFDDGTYAGCRLLAFLAREADPGAALDALSTSCATPDLHVPFAEGEALGVAAHQLSPRGAREVRGAAGG